MSKRFTDTTIWDKHWFRKLDPKYKVFWFYIKDKCNHAGIWDVDIELASFQVGFDYEKEDILKTFNSLIIPLDNPLKWLIPKFIEFQYGKLNSNHRVHKSVIKLLEKERVSIDLYQSIHTHKAKAKAKAKNKDSDKSKSILKDWNDFSEKNGLAKVVKLTKSRILKLNTRLLEPEFIFEDILIKLPDNKFLLGDNDRNWRVTFDWIIENDRNYIKILENTYVKKRSDYANIGRA